MENRPGTLAITDQPLQRSGRFNIIRVVLLAQLATSPLGLLLAAVFVVPNAELDLSRASRILLFATALLVIRNIILLIGAQYSNRQAAIQLGRWIKAPYRSRINFPGIQPQEACCGSN